jgi:hypothetical protein
LIDPSDWYFSREQLLNRQPRRLTSVHDRMLNVWREKCQSEQTPRVRILWAGNVSLQ